jgi:tryptophanyl-tRNA synthetase
MSKSVGNTIYLSETPEEVQRKVMGMYTDPKRIRATDPGTVEGNPVFIYLDTFGTEQDAAAIADFKQRYTEGKVGDMEVKRYLVNVMNTFLAPIRERRANYDQNPDAAKRVLKEGTERARTIVADTLAEVRRAFNFAIY